MADVADAGGHAMPGLVRKAPDLIMAEVTALRGATGRACAVNLLPAATEAVLPDCPRASGGRIATGDGLAMGGNAALPFMALFAGNGGRVIRHILPAALRLHCMVDDAASCFAPLCRCGRGNMVFAALSC